VSYEDHEWGAREEEFAEQVLEQQAFDYVFDNYPTEARDEVKQREANEWLEATRDWLQLINIVSQRDREHHREAVRRLAGGGATEDKSAGLTESQLFNVGSDVSAFLESVTTGQSKSQLPKTDAESAKDFFLALKEESDQTQYGYRRTPPAPVLARYAQYCTVSEDVDWVSDLLVLTRLFREILFALSDSDVDRYTLSKWLSLPIRHIDAALEKGPRPSLVYSIRAEGKVEFEREPNPSTTPLSTSLAVWMCDYLVKFREQIDLGACIECGKIFPRQRRDNFYCSKTCQNRVAYKRKKIFESGALQKIEVTPKTAAESIHAGVFAYHARLGMGVVEKVDKESGEVRAWVRFPHTYRIPTWNSRSLKTQVKSDVKIEFYAATDPATVAELM
jgi:hypothetical protein